MNHSTFKSFTFGIGLFFTLPLVYGNSSSPSSSDGTLYINKSKTHKVAPVKYGFHYEEIGMMGEGALHAELIRNRSFEEATPPAGLSVKNGLYENVPAPRVKEKKVFQADPLIGWTTYPLSYTPVFISRTDENPMSGENKYSMLVNVTEDIANHPDALILNRGYYGMNLKTDTSYRLSLFLKNRNYSAPLRVFLVDEWGQRVSNVIEVNVGNRDWTKYTGELKPEKNVRRGMFAIQPMSKGQFQIDVVSLFPSDTWNDGKSVFRKDIVQNLKEFSPSFIRFPGGSSNTVSRNYTEGIMSVLVPKVLELGYQYYDWNVSSGDGGTATTEEIIAQSETDKYHQVMLLFHDAATKETTIEALPTVLEYYKNLGYSFKAIDRESLVVHHQVNN